MTTATLPSGTRQSARPDGLGSTMAVVNASGVVQDSYTYDVYGKPTKTGALANEFDFAGQQTDGTGLQYLRARYMDPATGTFMSREPLAVGANWTGNPTGYAGANPIRATDPTGEQPTDSDGCALNNTACQNQSAPHPGMVESCTKGGCGWDYDWQFAAGLEGNGSYWTWLAFALTSVGDVVFGRCTVVGEYRNCSTISSGDPQIPVVGPYVSRWKDIIESCPSDWALCAAVVGAQVATTLISFGVGSVVGGVCVETGGMLCVVAVRGAYGGIHMIAFYGVNTSLQNELLRKGGKR